MSLKIKKHFLFFLPLFFAMSAALPFSAWAVVDVLIVSDMGGHESAADGVEKVLDHFGLSHIRINNQIFKMASATSFWDRVETFDANPDKINKETDAWNERTSKATSLLEVDNSILQRGFGKKRLLSLLESIQPKLVLFVTPWGVGSFVGLKNLGFTQNLPVAYVLTDYGTNNLYTKLIPTEIDMTFSPSPQWTAVALNRGVPQTQLTTSYMPTNPTALKTLNADEIEKLYSSLNVNNKSPVIFLSGGSAGIGNYPSMIESIEKEIQTPLQILVAIGNRPDAAARGAELLKLSTDNLKITLVPFRDDLPLIWKYIADIVVTKAGGLSSTELEIMEKIAIYLQPAVAGERENLKVAVGQGMALASTVEDLGKTISHFFSDPQLDASMKAKIKIQMKGYAIEQIGQWAKDTIEKNAQAGKPVIYHHLGLEIPAWNEMFENYSTFEQLNLEQKKNTILRLSRFVESEESLVEIFNLVNRLPTESVQPQFVENILINLRTPKSATFLKGSGLSETDLLTRLSKSNFFYFLAKLQNISPAAVSQFIRDFAPSSSIGYYSRFPATLLKGNSDFRVQANAALRVNTADLDWLNRLNKEVIYHELLNGDLKTMNSFSKNAQTKIKTLLGDLLPLAAKLLTFKANTQVITMPPINECTSILGGGSTTYLTEMEKAFFGQKRIALTFDDGPVSGTTPKILDILNKHGVKATFFQIGELAQKNPALTQRAIEEGHVVASHTVTHPYLDQISIDDADQEITDGHQQVTAAAGRPISQFFRFPYGNYNRTLLRLLEDKKIQSFGWNIDSNDWDAKINPTPEALIEYTLKKIRKIQHGVLLMHDIQPVTADALDRLLTELEKEGYSFIQFQ
jgi:peptidoglycan/xylan/chitin deacetylase (PgdA/CDA1 family)/UDP-N-acetylglucosamine:LPS N-acetylglucosamine transferase